MNKELSFLDILTILSFVIGVYAITIGLQNLEENRIQTEDTKEVLFQLNKHLEEQDKLLGKEV